MMRSDDFQGRRLDPLAVEVAEVAHGAAMKRPVESRDLWLRTGQVGEERLVIAHLEVRDSLRRLKAAIVKSVDDFTDPEATAPVRATTIRYPFGQEFSSGQPCREVVDKLLEWKSSEFLATERLNPIAPKLVEQQAKVPQEGFTVRLGRFGAL